MARISLNKGSKFGTSLNERLMFDLDRLQSAYNIARADLLAERTPDGHWVGELSTSALSTATAVSALSLARRHSNSLTGSIESCDVSATDKDRLINAGVQWLADHQNEDGGWGDTDKSYSNISTTMLVVAAFRLARPDTRHTKLLRAAENYVVQAGGIEKLRNRYGVDKTFAVPILANCALAGMVPWSEVTPLPFELACLPQSWYRLARLPVVSYAIPALVAVGQARFYHRPPRNPVLRWIRSLAVRKTLRVLEQMQPASGGYLEAIPLSSFVVMCLVATGRGKHSVSQAGLRFLREAVRSDGSWPIDTNLATWNTTLAINALMVADRCEDGFGASLPTPPKPLTEGRRPLGRVRVELMRGPTDPGSEDASASWDVFQWLLSCQHVQRHPYTGAAPGGWGWTDLSGAVPDADDTAGALLALTTKELGEQCLASRWRAVETSVDWLLDLQNSDGGWPTFCRGWGKLPFDRSGSDLTAHVIRALHAWRVTKPQGIELAIERGFSFLALNQNSDGSWYPLWFGDQDHPQEANPIYGTAKVLVAYRDLGRLDFPAAVRGRRWLTENQNPDGGWGHRGARRRGSQGDFSGYESGVEETALAVEGLLSAADDASLQTAIGKGLDWLLLAVQHNRHQESSPIGFYFAKLWYYERLYPIIFTTSTLGWALRAFSEQPTPTHANPPTLLTPLSDR